MGLRHPGEVFKDCRLVGAVRLPPGLNPLRRFSCVLSRRPYPDRGRLVLADGFEVRREIEA